MTSDKAYEREILDLVTNRSPETVGDLLKLMEEELQIPYNKALILVDELQDQGKLGLIDSQWSSRKDFNSYLFSVYAYWFWIIVAFSALTTLSVYAFSETAIPFVYVRNVFGVVYVVLLPGYCLIKVIYPGKEFDNLMRFVLSIGGSLAIVPIIGLILNYTPFGIKLTPLMVSLLLVNGILALLGLQREYAVKIREG